MIADNQYFCNRYQGTDFEAVCNIMDKIAKTFGLNFVS
jgi:hypothetical protein